MIESDGLSWAREIDGVLRQLSADHEQVLRLSYFEALSNDGIATRMNTSRSHVARLRGTALNHFSALLLI